jgi:transporter family protein
VLYRQDAAPHAAAWVAGTSLLSGLLVVLAATVGWCGPLSAPSSTRRALAASGLLQGAGLTAMIAALTSGHVATVAVLLTQTATLGVLLGATVLRQRLQPAQWAGVALSVSAAAVLAL